MQEIGKFDVKIEVIPNGLEKCMASMVNISLVFIDSMHFMDSSLHALVKNLSDNGSKYVSQEFSGELLELVDMYLYESMNSFKSLFDDRLLNKYGFYSSLRGKFISDKDYLHAVNV